VAVVVGRPSLLFPEVTRLHIISHRVAPVRIICHLEVPKIQQLLMDDSMLSDPDHLDEVPFLDVLPKIALQPTTVVLNTSRRSVADWLIGGLEFPESTTIEIRDNSM
jgi:hypothetical protein